MPRKKENGNGERHGVVCHWCHGDATVRSGEVWASPIEDCPGGWWRVCGPLCKKRPEGTRVQMMGGGR